MLILRWMRVTALQSKSDLRVELGERNPVSNSYAASALTVNRGLNQSSSYSDYCCLLLLLHLFRHSDFRLIELYFG